MKVVGIIPARYASARLSGKPIKDIQGHPIIGILKSMYSREAR